MVWSGLYYIKILTIAFGAIALLMIAGLIGPARRITPGYWEPPTLFNLGALTGGYAIEDAIFMFFVGGITAAVYEFALRKKIIHPHKRHAHHKAILIGSLCAAIFAISFRNFNLIYSLVVFGLTGALTLWTERRDLIAHSLFGGVVFLSIYAALFLFYNAAFPYFIPHYFHLENISGILLLGIPIEELLYAFSFGLFWSPIYEYEHGDKIGK